MGLYDREYYRDDQKGLVLGGDLSATTWLILVNAGIFIVDVFAEGQISTFFSLGTNVVQEPWYFWQGLTYGFAHDDRNVRHVLFNMFALWLFGRDVESTYGRKLYLQLYLSLIVISGLVWLVLTLVTSDAPARLVGASGAVTGIMIIFVLHWPTRTLLLWGVVPIPVWLLASLQLLQDIQGAMTQRDASDVAYTAHLAGAAFGFLFYKTGFQLGRLLPGRLSLRMFKRRPKLRVRDAAQEDDLGRRVDQILEKISREGEASLTKDERRTLERASRKYQEKRQ